MGFAKGKILLSFYKTKALFIIFDLESSIENPNNLEDYSYTEKFICV